MDFNENGLLPAGFHTYTFPDFKTDFVTSFPSSQSREPIFSRLELFAEFIFNNFQPKEFWIDGSFATAKVNPNDADLILFLSYEDARKISPMWGSIRQNFQSLDMYFGIAPTEDLQKRVSSTDFYAAINNRNYWRGQFGFDRQDNPKGIIRIDCETAHNYFSHKEVV